tara:strand:- start:3199 stop:4665 length:1467 start_codon:yes stop_codon:yes gene_type:complete
MSYPGVTPVSLTDFGPEQKALERRRKMAEMMQRQAMEPIEAPTSGGHVGPISPVSVLAKLVQGYMSGRNADKMDEQEADIRKKSSAERATWLSDVLKKGDVVGTENVPVTAPMEATFDVPGLQPAKASLDLPSGFEQQDVVKPRTYADRMALLLQGAASGREDITSMIPALTAAIKPEEYAGSRYGRFERDPMTGRVTQTQAAMETSEDMTDYDRWKQNPAEFAAYKAAGRRPVAGGGGGGGAPSAGGGVSGSSTKFDQKTIDFMAEQALTGDTSVFANLGYGRAGAENKTALRNAVTKKAVDAGMSGKDVAAMNAQFFGIKAGQRTLGTREANIGMAVNEAQLLMPLALKASEGVDRTKFPSLNSVILAAKQGTGDPNVVRLGIATNSLINIYARAINPSGVPTVSDKEHARELLSNAWATGQYAAGVDQLNQEMNAAKKSPGRVREDLRRATVGEPERTSAPPRTVVRTGKLNGRVVREYSDGTIE